MSVRTILVGVDDSLGSRAALAWAGALALDLGARVVAVHAFEPLAHVQDLAPGVDLRALRERETAKVAGPLCADLRARGIPHETLVREGDPATVLVDVADSIAADLLVVGARRQGNLRGLLLGSTSSRLAHLTRRPVVIVHAPLEADG
jgi:nucleotide-binding universal stress UspA family protein